MSTNAAAPLTMLLTVAALAVAGTVHVQPARQPGLLVRFYEIDADVAFLPELAPGQLPNSVRTVATLDLRDENKGFGELKDHFLTEVLGTLQIDTAGRHTFRLLSDDGAKLWIDERLVIDHDGLHGPDPKDGTIELTPGPHALRIWHFQIWGGQQLTLQWQPAGAAADKFELLPPATLSHDPGVSRETSPGKKKIIPPLRRGRPGDGSPLAGIHPAFDQTLLPSAMYGVMQRRECDRLIIAASPTAGWEKGGILLPRADAEPTRVTWAQLADPRHPLGPRWPAGAEGDPCLIPLVVGVAGTDELYRVVTEDVGGVLQGCVFRFAGALPGAVARITGAIPDAIIAELEVNKSETCPDGKALCFLRPNEHLVFEMLAVRAMSNGMEIEFTKALDPRCGWEAGSFYVEQWPWSTSEGHRGPARDGSSVPVKSASVSPDRKRVFLEIEALKPGCVTYIRLLPPCISEDGELPWSTEAWYTLSAIPADRFGTVLPAPAPEPANFLTDAEKAAGWKLLFDGQTTRGWHGWKKDHVPDGWAVRDGCLVRVGPGAGDIVTDEEFDNFELSLEWRICAGGNSGTFFRVAEDPKYDAVWRTGPEMQVLDNAEHADGRSPLTSAGSNYALHAPLRDVTQPVGFFNQARIVADGPHIEYWLNGVKIVEYEIGSPQWEALVAASKFAQMPDYGRMKKGRIALQDHGDMVWYRNIKIRALPPH